MNTQRRLVETLTAEELIAELESICRRRNPQKPIPDIKLWDACHAAADFDRRLNKRGKKPWTI